MTKQVLSGIVTQLSVVESQKVWEYLGNFSLAYVIYAKSLCKMKKKNILKRQAWNYESPACNFSWCHKDTLKNLKQHYFTELPGWHSCSVYQPQ